jgi:hypothetical protein
MGAKLGGKRKYNRLLVDVSSQKCFITVYFLYFHYLQFLFLGTGLLADFC